MKVQVLGSWSGSAAWTREADCLLFDAAPDAAEGMEIDP